MTNRNNFNWEFACPKFVDFKDPKVLELNVDDVDTYFESEHEFSFNTKLGEALKVESILAAAEAMASPGVTPSRPASSVSNYRTPPDGLNRDLESDEVFYTTRKSYDLRETECRRLKQIGASPYRIPGGKSTTGKKKSRRPPFTPKVVEENAKQIEEELLVQSLKKILFMDSDEKESHKPEVEDSKNTPLQENCEQGKENSCQSHQDADESSPLNVSQGSNDYSMELMVVSPNTYYDCDSQVLSAKDISEMLLAAVTDDNKSEESLEDESTEVYSAVLSNEAENIPAQDEYVPVCERFNSSRIYKSLKSFIVDECETEVFEEERISVVDINRDAVNMEVEEDEKLIETDKENEQDVEIENVPEAVPKASSEPEKDQAECEPPEILINPPIHSKSSVASPSEGHSKSTEGFTSDNCWTDVDDETGPTTSKTQEKRRRPLRRESFVKSSAALASTVNKADPQKRLYRLLSYTAPPKNKYRSLAELSKDFETKIRAYTPPNLKSTKAQWTPTKPVSPKLTACKRKRTLTCVSLKDQEESIAQSIKKNTFKATPFNKKTYLSTVNVGVKRVDPKPTTKPIPFSFQSEKRIEARRSRIPTDLFNKPTSESARKPRKWLHL